jgi:type IV pilus assembly protein PilE
MKTLKTSLRGFTLIELMITVAILGILSAIAIPSYTQYVQNGKRADARAALLQASQYLQRFYAANDRYDSDRSGTGITIPAGLTVVPQGAMGTDIAYQLTANIQTINAQDFTLKMEPLNSMAADKCGKLTVTNLGVRSFEDHATTATRTECWK